MYSPTETFDIYFMMRKHLACELLRDFYGRTKSCAGVMTRESFLCFWETALVSYLRGLFVSQEYVPRVSE